MKSIEVLNEVKPKFAPKVQAIWDDCGTHVTSMEANIAAKEIEFFVEKLVVALVEDYDHSFWGECPLIEFLARKGYVNE